MRPSHFSTKPSWHATTITFLKIGVLHTDAGGFQLLDINTEIVIEKVILVFTVGAGYVTIAGIFYYLLRDRLVKVKSIFVNHFMPTSKEKHQHNVVTHSEVGLSHEQSIIHSTDMILNLEESRQSVSEFESVVTPPAVILKERVRFAKLREGLLER